MPFIVNTTYYINVRETRRGIKKMNNPETLAVLGTLDTRQENTTQKTNKMSNMDPWLIVRTIYILEKIEGTIQTRWQHWTHNTQDVDRQNTKQKTNKMRHRATTNLGEPRCS